MTRANTCNLDNRIVGVAEAADLREAAHRRHAHVPDFRCIQCDKPVRPHKESEYGVAHFEHWQRNPQCELSDPVQREHDNGLPNHGKEAT